MKLNNFIIAIGAEVIIKKIKFSKHSGDLLDVVSTFCITFFYLTGIIATIKFLIW